MSFTPNMEIFYQNRSIHGSEIEWEVHVNNYNFLANLTRH